jgi:hypothetical protein
MKWTEYLAGLAAVTAALWSATAYSDDSQVRRRAEAKVKDYFSVKFETGSVLGPSVGKQADDYTASISQVARAVKANKAVMMYFYVEVGENEKDGGLKARAEKCAKLEQEVFSGDEKVQELGFLARFCQKYKVEVSKVKAKDNPYYNSETAPVIVVVAGNGDIVATLTGSAVAPDSITKALGDALTKSGIDAKAISAKQKRNGKPLLNLEIKKETLDKEIGDADKKISEWRKDPKKVQDAVKLEKEMKVKEAELTKAKQDIADIKKTLEEVPEVKDSKK